MFDFKLFMYIGPQTLLIYLLKTYKYSLSKIITMSGCVSKTTHQSKLKPVESKHVQHHSNSQQTVPSKKKMDNKNLNRKFKQYLRRKNSLSFRIKINEIKMKRNKIMMRRYKRKIIKIMKKLNNHMKHKGKVYQYDGVNLLVDGVIQFSDF